MERIRPESIRRTIVSNAVGLMIISLSACIPSGADAVTTPYGIFYKDSHPSQFIVDHEQCHWERAQQDPEFFNKYANDPAYACEEERRCGIEPKQFPEVYPRCQ